MIHEVYFILDTNFDGDLWALSRKAHVWILQSSRNDAAASVSRWTRRNRSASPRNSLYGRFSWNPKAAGSSSSASTKTDAHRAPGTRSSTCWPRPVLVVRAQIHRSQDPVTCATLSTNDMGDVVLYKGTAANALTLDRPDNREIECVSILGREFRRAP